ncbi:putative SNAP25 homologous protein SNAP30 [Ananas comosus]|uniref:SNAP25 homologous protein SNAP30 n=3 Tax=Ananas comosus TaxID=4615 RepID=A0A6P5FG61_ANACO|nr:putative SNAP25 homologous protein SNAP30 [Ananas comosus]XP_020092447.1 putative SNAP25 homologous protein SNAP30 [Ananas comosus]XP_020092448.1 putative SNAP25 homologous protein SNAP30 [Ananas comosus]
MSNANIMRTPNDEDSKQRSVDCRFSGTNQFDSDSELDLDRKPPRAFSAPPISKANCSKNSQHSHEENEEKGTSTFSFFLGFSADRNRYRNDFNGSESIENQSAQELENYAACKSEETTKKVNGCLRIAEEIRESASRTLLMLHQQGQQITQTHKSAVDIENDLSRGEKLLASLGGIFSRTWKPTKASPMKGPLLTGDDSFEREGNHMEQRRRLGISGSSLQSSPQNTVHGPTSALEITEIEKAKQDTALSDLSNLLGELKEMAVDMGAELDRQTAALGNMEDDIEVLNSRVKGANIRGRRLLGK